MDNRSKRKAARGVLLAVVLMLISMVGASFIQTSAGRVEVKDLRFETSLGYEMSALLYKPKWASADNKAPAVIACHGMYNNREMQDINLVELSRRGYVVLSIDMFSHGNSQNLPSQDLLPMGALEALKMVRTLNYVDTQRIGLTGHSMGGMNCDIAALMGDDGVNPPVAALLLNSCFATYQDTATGVYVNAYGSKNVGIIAGQFDEFLFKEVNEDGTVLLAKDFIRSDNAQSFLNFGENPGGKEVRSANTMYRREIDGKEAIRVIYNPAVTHPWSHFSRRSAKATIEFFDAALGTPDPMEPSRQVWQIKELFNLLGLTGMGIFAVNMALLLTHTGMFGSLRAEQEAPSKTVSPRWRRLGAVFGAATVIFCAASYLPIVIGAKSDNNGRLLFAQNTTFGIGLWAAVCGLLMIACMFIRYKLADGEERISLEETGIRPDSRKLVLTVILGAGVAAASYLWVGIGDYFFKTDFRIWVLAAKAVNGEKVLITLFPNLILFLVFYAASSVQINCFECRGEEDVRRAGRSTAVCALTAVAPSAILVIMQYVHLFGTGSVLFEKNNAHSMILWLFPMLVLIPASVVISRRIYRETKNPYLPAVINAILITLISCANTSTWG